MNQDGTELETLNHIGRQEIRLYSNRNFNDDPNVEEFYGQYATGANQNDFVIFLHIKELPNSPGTYMGTSCQEFGTHSAGQVLTITGAPDVNPDDMVVSYLTHPDTATASNSPSGDHSGLYRDPLPLTNGQTIVSHTANTLADSNLGTRSNPLSHYDFRLKLLQSGGSHQTAGTAVTSGITKSISFWDPDELVSYNGELWEVMPVEVVSRSRPVAPAAQLPDVEQGVLDSMGIDLSELQDYLRQQNLALLVGRDLTTRDRNDLQQPTNLRVSGTNTESIPRSGKVYNISWLQFFQGDLIRSYTNRGGVGRRVIAQPMHGVDAGVNPTIAGAPAGSVKIAEDGSMAAFVPASRALTWHTTDGTGEPVVRERYWVTFQPGEVRVCTSCHGINTADHLGNSGPTNPPLALSQLMSHWKNEGASRHRINVKGLPRTKAGGRFALNIQGGNENDLLKVKLAVSHRRSSGVRSLGSIRSFRGRFPGVRGVQLTFSLYGRGSNAVLDKDKARIRGKAKRLSSRDRRTIARRVLRSLR